MDQVKIGAFLRKLRTERGMTQGELAERFGVTNRSVSRWETGTNLPELTLLIELSDFYGVELRELLDGERRERPEQGSGGDQTEESETIKKVAEYSAGERDTLARFMIRYSLLAVALNTVAIALNVFGADEVFPMDMLTGFCQGAAYGMLLIIALYFTGKLERIRVWKNKIVSDAGGRSRKYIGIAALLFLAALCYYMGYLYDDTKSPLKLCVAGAWTVAGGLSFVRVARGGK